MTKLKFILFGTVLLGAAMPAHAFCMIVDHTYPKEGWITSDPRQMTVADEFRAADLVLTGKVVSMKKRGVDKDGFFESTDFRIEPLSTFKGSPPKRLITKSGNGSGRFDMDVGKSYLLFVSLDHRGNYVDPCGWSNELEHSKPAMKALEQRATFSKLPSHCWKNKRIRGCVPDLRTYPGGKKPDGAL